MTERTMKEQIVETFEILSDHVQYIELMNKYLNAGWILLENWVVGVVGDQDERRETAHFLFGRTDHSQPSPLR